MKVVTIGSTTLVELFSLIGAKGYVAENEEDVTALVRNEWDELSEAACVLTTDALYRVPGWVRKLREARVAVMAVDRDLGGLADSVERVLGVKIQRLVDN